MSKKDCIKLAQALKDSKPENIGKFFTANSPTERWNAGMLDSWKNTVETIAMTLQQDNPRLDKARFLHACGYGE